MTITVPARLPRWNGIVYPPRLAGGMGQDDGSYITGSDVSIPTDTGSWLDTLPSLVDVPTNTIAPSPTPTTGVNNSNLTASTLNSLLTGGLKIAQITAAQQTPAGTQLLYNSQGQLVSASTQPPGVPLNTSALSTTGISSSSLMLIALAGLAVLAMGGMRH